MSEKSAGHIAFLDDGRNEAFVLKDEVYIAPTHNPISTYGYRLGRWECSKAHWDRYYDAIFKQRVVAKRKRR